MGRGGGDGKRPGCQDVRSLPDVRTRMSGSEPIYCPLGNMRDFVLGQARFAHRARTDDTAGYAPRARETRVLAPITICARHRVPSYDFGAADHP